MAKIAEVLPGCARLQGLYLGHNPGMTDGGAVSLAAKLLRCRELKTLRLDACQIGDQGAMALFENIPYCTIEILGLLANQISDKACKVRPMAVVATSHVGQQLHVPTCPRKVLGRSMREKGFKKIQSINLERNEIGDAGVAALAASLVSVPGTALHLSPCRCASVASIAACSRVAETLLSSQGECPSLRLQVSQAHSCMRSTQITAATARATQRLECARYSSRTTATPKRPGGCSSVRGECRRGRKRSKSCLPRSTPTGPSLTLVVRVVRATGAFQSQCADGANPSHESAVGQIGGA